MMNARALAIAAALFISVTIGLHGQGVPQYRNFTLGKSLASVSTTAGISSSEAKTIHQRPALMQELEWRPSRWVTGSSSPSTDPVEQIGFSFYNDQLFRIVVDYRSDLTAGLTDADMIEAISALYGTPVKRISGAVRTPSLNDTESGSVLARWGDTGLAVVLYRASAYRAAFRLMVTEPAVEDLARKATIQAVRLDEQEAPLRELARQKKERDDDQAAAEKARTANKGGFRP